MAPVKFVFIALLLAAMTASGFAQLSPAATWAAQAAAQYAVSANVTYRTASNQQLNTTIKEFLAKNGLANR
jgi:hypothetical protein